MGLGWAGGIDYLPAWPQDGLGDRMHSKGAGCRRRDSELFTCNKALAGIPCRQGVDAEGGVGYLVAAILDGDGVPTTHIWQVGHGICAIPIVSDVGLLGFTLRILEEEERSGLPTSTESGWAGGCA